MTRRAGGVLTLLVAPALLVLLVVLGVDAVRGVRAEQALAAAWEAADAARWDEVAARTQPLVDSTPVGRRAAQLRCWALLAAGDREACGALLDRVLTPLPERDGFAADPLLVRLAVLHRQDTGRPAEAAALALRASEQHPDDLQLLQLEIATRAAIEDEDAVLADFERRIAEREAGGSAALALRTALAHRRRQRAEWDAALRALGERPPPAGHRLLGAWFDERGAALAAQGRLDALRASFDAWRARGGDPIELQARYALRLSISQLYDPERPWVDALRAALANAGRLRDPGLVRQLHERLIAHHLVDGDPAAALRVFDAAQAAGVALRGITREQLERGAVLAAAGGDPQAIPDASLVFEVPEALRDGTLLVSDNAGRPPDAPYVALPVAGAASIRIARRPTAWPERWVLRDAGGAVRASGGIWARPGAERRVAIEARPPVVPRRAAARVARAAADGRRRVFALVLDCGDWRLLQYLRARGELPVLESMLARGHRAVLLSDPPLTAAAMDALVWPERGPARSVVAVLHQLGVELAGLESVGRNPFAWLAPLLPESTSLFERIGSGEQVAANMLFTHGLIDAGRHAEMLGPGGRRRMVETARARRPLRPGERRDFAGIDAEPEARGHVEAIAAELDAAQALARAGEIDLLLLRVEALDILTHALYSGLAATRQDDGESNLLAVYRYLDARIGGLDAQLDADDVLVVMSDHGIRTAMEHARDAIFIAVGGGVPSGRAEGQPALRGVPRVLAGLLGVETPWPATGVAAFAERTPTPALAAGAARMDPRGGFEPPLTDSESAVLPLDDRGSRPLALRRAAK